MSMPAPPPAPELRSSAAPARLLRLARKELREVLRDRRTILTLVLMPLLLYLLLYFALPYLPPAGSAAEDAPEYRLGVSSQAEAERVRQILELGNQLLTRSGHPDSQPRLAYFEPAGPDEDAARNLKNGNLHLVIRLRTAGGRAVGDGAPWPVECEIHYLEDSASSKEALAYVQARFVAANVPLAIAQARRPVRVQVTPVEAPDHRSRFPLAALVPLVLLLMTITGAVYPAIDLTAGERERGTLEMLMAAPVPRVLLLLAKYVAVVTVAVLTALLNLAMMGLVFLIRGKGPESLSAAAVLAVLGLVVLFALFFSAVLLVLTSFARSFKEAQASLIPLMLLALLPGLLALVPGLRLEGLLSIVPLLNIVLLGRDLLEGHASAGAGAAAVISTLTYAAAALLLAARTFGAEAVLYRDTGGWRDLFRRRR